MCGSQRSSPAGHSLLCAPSGEPAPTRSWRCSQVVAPATILTATTPTRHPVHSAIWTLISSAPDNRRSAGTANTQPLIGRVAKDTPFSLLPWWSLRSSDGRDGGPGHRGSSTRCHSILLVAVRSLVSKAKWPENSKAPSLRSGGLPSSPYAVRVNLRCPRRLFGRVVFVRGWSHFGRLWILPVDWMTGLLFPVEWRFCLHQTSMARME